MEMPRTLADFEARAAEVLDDGPHGYFAGGAGDELTLRDNVESWRRLAIRPRVMVDVSRCDPATTLLGRERAHPILVAPVAYQRLAHQDGEPATARAAAATGSVFCLSSLATATPAEVAAAAPEGPRWLQLYVFRERAVTDRLVADAAEHGYEALVLTVDLPALGVRERDVRSRFEIADALAVPSVGAMGREGPLSMLGIGELIDPTLTWPEVERFAERSGLPVLVKGILRPDDARRAVEHGAAGVIVSNHGGRQLDTVLSGADALPAVVDEVGGEVDVLVDGGIRRGSDVLKALALGARAVLVGRPVVWGLAVGGETGARAVLETLLAELEVALALAGVPCVADVDRSLVQPAPWSGHVP
jgi:isopentenyl diphosphate isomerase/L-lactate dehydrogenase-like FMN-dependent dehydrogenase